MPAPDLDFRNVNSLWASVLAETLARQGIRQAVISPGSRSTPLTFAFARCPRIEAIPVLDERSAGFFALGLARQRLRPVVLLCTSGTAAANYLPAVIEAHESGVPLLIITADRPPEMRACASGQTIDQTKLYGAYVNFFHELAVPEASEPLLAYARQSAAHACRRTTHPFPGPVHLNAPFRDPLPPVPDGSAEKLIGRIDTERFFAHVEPPPAVELLTRVPELKPDAHGIVVAGPVQPRDPGSFVASLGEIAGKLGWPILADGLSPARNHASRIPHLVTGYDSILRDPERAEQLRPEQVLCLGGWPTSKVLRAWLERCAAPTWLISGRPDNRDALHGRTVQLPLSLRALASGIPRAAGGSGYERLWADAESQVRAVIDRRLDGETALFEPKAAWLLARHLPEETPIFVASSMPVRDVEYFWPAGDRRIRPYFNRGANGIDGTLSSAMGMAHGNRPAVLLTGDLALLHDTNGFLLRPKLRGSLTVVLINNHGGGIFEHLPVAGFEPPFEEYFATPQEADFAHLAAAYGADHMTIRNWAQFVDLIATLPAAGVRVIEIPADRKRDAAMRRGLCEGAARAPG